MLVFSPSRTLRALMTVTLIGFGTAVHAQQARAKGFALDMAVGGADDEDMDFRESA